MTEKMDIVYLPLTEIIPYARNPRNNLNAVDKVAASIKEFGWQQASVVDSKNTIIAGHTRYLAAQKLGLDKAPVHIASYLTERQVKAFRLTDNRVSQEATWNTELLALEFEDLKALDFDLLLTGFNVDEIANLFPEELPPGEEDKVPEVADEAISKHGDIWILGNHRLMCGDSTAITDVEKLMNGKKAQMIFTDPPYGVDFEQGKHIGRDKKPKDRSFDLILNDEKKDDELSEFIKEVLLNASSVCETCSIYVWSPPLMNGFAMLKGIIDSGFHIQSQIIWNKSNFIIGRCDYHWKHEVCWYGYKGQNHLWFGERDKSSIWDCPKTASSDLHPTMKPVQLAEIAINNSTKKSHIVLDVFGGSGSTLIACEKTSRNCFMMELSEKYCDVIIKRWQEYTGKKAIHSELSKTFEEIQNKK